MTPRPLSPSLNASIDRAVAAEVRSEPTAADMDCDGDLVCRSCGLNIGPLPGRFHEKPAGSAPCCGRDLRCSCGAIASHPDLSGKAMFTPSPEQSYPWWGRWLYRAAQAAMAVAERGKR